MRSKVGLGVKKITALLLCIALLFLAGAPQVRADELSDLRAEYDNLTKKIAEREKLLDKNSTDKSKQQAVIADLNAQIDDIDRQMKILTSSIGLLQTDIGNLKGSITQYRADIATLGEKIDYTAGEIEARQAEVEKTEQEALARLRASYVAGNPSKIDILLSSEDLSVFFFNIELLKQIDKQEKELMKKLRSESDALSKTKAGLEKDKAALEQTKLNLDVKLGDLETKKSQKDADAEKFKDIQNSINSKNERAKAEVAKLNKDSAEYKAQIARLEREQDETDRRIDALIAKQGSSSGDTNAVENEGAMTWPVPYPSVYISAGYPTYPSGGKHGGIDICVTGGSMGKNFVAAQGGVIISSGWNGSYGNCVIIDHGGGLFTVYGHASRLVVNKGDRVNKGQKIGEIGSTGNSTGPHLHFEVRVNSNSSVNRVQPLNYFPGKPNKVNVSFSGI